MFDQVVAAHPGMRFLWLDIEQDAELVGELDIETFPTLLIADGAALRFAGPLLPHAGTLSRLLASLDNSAMVTGSADPALTDLVQVLHRRLSSA